MSNLGKYQTIVKEAYKAGGVDAWLKTIKDAAYSQGVPILKIGYCFL